jgi:hypothetical protein
MHTKLDVIKANGKQIEEGLTTFDVSITSVIHALTAEGTKIKALVDQQVEKMIATSCCMFQSADQHHNHLFTLGCNSQRGILVAVQRTASKSHHFERESKS